MPPPSKLTETETKPVKTHSKKSKFLHSLDPRRWSLCCPNFSKFKNDKHTPPPHTNTPPLKPPPPKSSDPESDLVRGYQAFQRKEYRIAKAYYELAASQNHPLALHNLGVMHLYGQGMPPNYQLAQTYFKLAICQKCTPSLSQVGYMYLYGKGCTPNYILAYQYFTEAADSNDSYALFQLGYMHLYNKAPQSSTKVGINYLRNSMQLNYTPAIYHLGCIFMLGLFDVKPNKHAAKALFTHAAHFGNDPHAENNLGCLIAESSQTPTDFETAMYYFKSASEQGVSEAAFNLGECLSFGIGCTANPAKAREAYFTATKLGKNTNAEYKLALSYLNDDLNLALHWLEKASDKGHAQAQIKLKALQKFLEQPKSQRSPQFLASTKLFN